MYKFVGFILVLSLVAVLGDFPASIKRCPKKSSDCFKKTVMEVLKKYPSGFRELNLLPYDPLRIKSLILGRNPSSPVNLELSFKDLDLFGLSMANVKEIKGFNFEEPTLVKAVVPELRLKGKYNVNGNVLILPITGKGDSDISIQNLGMKYTFGLKPVNKNGKIYAELENVKLELKPERMHFKFENLFNGDKALGDNMNKFLNENWIDIFTELKAGIEKGMCSVITELINTTLTKFPFDDFFL